MWQIVAQAAEVHDSGSRGYPWALTRAWQFLDTWLFAQVHRSSVLLAQIFCQLQVVQLIVAQSSPGFAQISVEHLDMAVDALLGFLRLLHKILVESRN